MSTPEEFYEELFQDIKTTADAYGVYLEDAFFDTVTDYLIDAGEFDEAERAFYRPERGGIRIDGYCGDPLDSMLGREEGQATLGLIALDFNQDTELTTLTNSEMEADFRRLQKFLSSSLDAHFRSSLEPTDPGFGLADLINARWDKISRVKFYLLTNKKLSSRVTGKDMGDFDGREIVYNVWDIVRFGNLVSSGRERERLTVDFNELPNGALRALLASKPNDKNQVYLAAIPGLDLACIYDRWGARLLEQNVRVFLQARSKVNKGIRRTLENEPELFFSFNNGITATAEAIKTETRDEGLVITSLDNLQIVNGGQTTASVYAAYKAKNDLSKVFIQMKLSIVSPETAKELVPRISEYANSQNKVSAADFFANHPFHVRMEGFSRRIMAPAKPGSFDLTKWFYERARGSYRDAQAYLTPAAKRKFVKEYPKAQTFTKTDLAKYVMVWTDKAYMVNRGAQKNFSEFAKDIAEAWEKDDKQFNEVYFKHVVAKKIVFDLAGKIVQTSEWYEAGGYRSQHVVLAVGALANAAKDMGKSVDFLSIWNRQGVTPAFERALGQAADVAHQVLMNPGEGYRNISEWAKQPKCWNAVKQVQVHWDEDWTSELISTEEEKDIKSAGARAQKELNGIEAQSVVVEAGPQFWQDVLDWCTKEGEATDKERGILRYAAAMPNKIPSDKQSVVLVNLMARLRKSGCPYRLKTHRRRIRG
ncbi:AIPR family protein [Cryptobacterium curtum]|uniref:AIPR family protein n=1 Tax=Cryptobacterium curtum TaxID=84163 RepID=UPI00248EB029|nr:AIPR family protein [Cryptobacterium curtum]